MPLPWPQLFLETLALFPPPPASLSRMAYWQRLTTRPAYRGLPVSTLSGTLSRLCERRLLVRVGHGHYRRDPAAV